MTKNNSDRKLKRRQFLGVSMTAGAGFMLAPFVPIPLSKVKALSRPPITESLIPLHTPLVTGPINAEEAGGIEGLEEFARDERAVSILVPMDDWTNYGKLFEAFRAKYPFLTIAAFIR